MKKCPSEETLLKLAQNELDERETDFARKHVLLCERCRRLLAEYRETLSLLGEERIPGLDTAEWQRLMTAVKATAGAGAKPGSRSALTQRLGQKRQAWPAWSKGVAVAAAAALVLIIVRNAGVVDPGRLVTGIGRTIRGEKLTTAGERYSTSGESLSVAETWQAEDTTVSGQGSVSEEVVELLSEEMVSVPDSTSSGLATLTDQELDDVSQLSTSGSALADYGAVLADLTDEEQAELLKALETFSLM